MDSLLANYASSDEEEHEQEQSPPRVPPAKPVKSEAKVEQEKDEDSLSKSTSKRGAIVDSLPQPKSSLFNSLPPPKSQSLPKPEPQAELRRQKAVGERDEVIVENSKPKSSSSFSSSLFSSLPLPKSTSSSSSSASKRVVQFRPPMVFNPYATGGDDKEDDDADEDEKERERKRSREAISTSSPASFFSSMPAPKHSATLGAMPSASSTGRRSILETDKAVSSASTGSAAGSDAVNSSVGYLKDQSSEMSYDYSSWSSGSESHAYYNGYGAASDGTDGLAGTDAGMNSNVGHMGDQSHDIYHHSSSLGGDSYAYYSGHGVAPEVASSTAGSDAVADYSNAGSYEAVDYSSGNGHVEYQNYSGSYGDYGSNAQYENNWANATALPEASSVVEHALQLPGKRGKKDAPAKIVEVNQDELMKNRPREDQVKLTGIAFGPAYQPASTKGKPTKLHKRKHQIGSLYFDMKQKETELAERRSKGFLTKAQTQAKYGW